MRCKLLLNKRRKEKSSGIDKLPAKEKQWPRYLHGYLFPSINTLQFCQHLLFALRSNLFHYFARIMNILRHTVELEVQRYSSFKSRAEWGGCQWHPRPLFPREIGWVSLGVGLERQGKPRIHRGRKPGPSSTWRVAIPNTFFRPFITLWKIANYLYIFLLMRNLSENIWNASC